MELEIRTFKVRFTEVLLNKVFPPFPILTGYITTMLNLGLSKPASVSTVSPGTQGQPILPKELNTLASPSQNHSCGPPEDDPFGSAPFSMPAAMLIGGGGGVGLRKASGGGGGGND